MFVVSFLHMLAYSELLMRKLRYFWLSCRPKQWIKNTFLFLPLLFSGRLFDLSAWWKISTAFLVFCLVSSGVYLWNDVVDRKGDKSHPIKRLRPIASGKFSSSLALMAFVVLVVSALLIAFSLEKLYGFVILLYLGANFLYTVWFKKVVLLDVFSFAMFFVLRIVGGLFVLKVSFSYWMLILVALLALFLALNKRRYELVKLAKKARWHRGVLDHYDPYLIDQFCSAIVGAIVVIYCIFTIDSQQVIKFGSHNMVFSIPFVFYGLFRYQYLVLRRGRGGDPAEIILSDRGMIWNIVLWAVVCSLAIYTRTEWIPIQVMS